MVGEDLSITTMDKDYRQGPMAMETLEIFKKHKREEGKTKEN